MPNLDVQTLVAATVALLILADISFLWVTGKQVPELLTYLATSVFGYYFGAANKRPAANHDTPAGPPVPPDPQMLRVPPAVPSSPVSASVPVPNPSPLATVPAK